MELCERAAQSMGFIWNATLLGQTSGTGDPEVCYYVEPTAPDFETAVMTMRDDWKQYEDFRDSNRDGIPDGTLRFICRHEEPYHLPTQAPTTPDPTQAPTTPDPTKEPTAVPKTNKHDTM